MDSIQENMRAEEGRHNWTQTTFNNGVKVENKTLNIWRELVSYTQMVDTSIAAGGQN